METMQSSLIKYGNNDTYGNENGHMQNFKEFGSLEMINCVAERMHISNGVNIVDDEDEDAVAGGNGNGKQESL